MIHLMEYLDISPVSGAQIKAWTESDPTLLKVKGMTLSGWPTDTSGMEEELHPFARRKYELSVEEGWGNSDST